MANNEEIEIDLVRLGRYVLSKWKVILFWGVVFSCLGFCYKFFAFKFSDVPLEELDKQFKIVRDEKQPDGKVQRKEYKVSYRIYKDDYESRMREYRANLDSYKVTKDNLLEKKNQIQQKIDILNDYLSKSLLFKDNSSDMQEAVFFYSIRDLNAVKEGSVQADNPAVSFALSFLQSSNFLYRVSEKIGLDLGEYRNLGLIEDFLKVDSKVSKVSSISKDSFIVHLLADSEDKLRILEKELEYFNTKLSIFCKDRYNVDVEEIGSGKVQISELSEYRNQALEELLTLQDDLNKINAKIAFVAEPVKFDDYGKLVNLETFKVMKLIQFIAIGLLFGLFISVCYYIFRYLTAGKLRDQNFISDSFGGKKSKTGMDAQQRHSLLEQFRADAVCQNGPFNARHVLHQCSVDQLLAGLVGELLLDYGGGDLLHAGIRHLVRCNGHDRTEHRRGEDGPDETAWLDQYALRDAGDVRDRPFAAIDKAT